MGKPPILLALVALTCSLSAVGGEVEDVEFARAQLTEAASKASRGSATVTYQVHLWPSAARSLEAEFKVHWSDQSWCYEGRYRELDRPLSWTKYRGVRTPTVLSEHYENPDHREKILVIDRTPTKTPSLFWGAPHHGWHAWTHPDGSDQNLANALADSENAPRSIEIRGDRLLVNRQLVEFPSLFIRGEIDRSTLLPRSLDLGNGGKIEQEWTTTDGVPHPTVVRVRWRGRPLKPGLDGWDLVMNISDVKIGQAPEARHFILNESSVPDGTMISESSAGRSTTHIKGQMRANFPNPNPTE